MFTFVNHRLSTLQILTASPSTAALPASDASDSPSNALPAGSIAAIVIMSVFGLLLIVAAAIVIAKRVFAPVAPPKPVLTTV
jgi:hypothetical protein